MNDSELKRMVVILTGNVEKIQQVRQEIEQFDINICIWNVMQKFYQGPKGNIRYIVICHNKYHEYREYLKEIVKRNAGLENICISQFQFYKLIAKGKLKENKIYGEIFDNNDIACISLQFGFVFGGLETFAANLYKYLKKYISRNYIIDIKYDFLGLNYVGGSFYQISDNDIFSLDSQNGFFENVRKIIQFIYKVKPKYIFENGSMEMLVALSIIKSYCNIQVIHIVHCDSEFMYQQCLWFKEDIDSFWCVSQEIYEKLSKMMMDRKADCSVYIQYPEEDSACKKREENKVLEIAYAARLDRQTKRSYLLIDLIKCLEKKHINYRLHIAGSGECLEEIQRFVNEKRLCNVVKIYGLLPYQEMKTFWQDKDIFLNFSIKEGTSISLLEAMNYGVIPIVTETSGVHDLIKNYESGFIENTVEKMVEKIKILVENRELREKISQQTKNIIREKYQKNNQLDEVFDFE